MSGHTPGPWKHGKGVDGHYRIYRRKSVICQFGEGIDEDWRECKNSKANARLIASAPDLLEALRFCVQHDGGECLGDHPARLAQARAVIRKATGES
jgi:5'-deoxynucleotidase YfbR-like HD superfamily hydrolase